MDSIPSPQYNLDVHRVSIPRDHVKNTEHCHPWYRPGITDRIFLLTWI